jgi:ABC-type sugar transport system substrate-binding protein
MFNLISPKIAKGLAALAVLFVSGCTKQSKSDYVVGYSQVGAESAWRTAETRSMKETASKNGIDFRFADAQNNQANQIKAIRSFIEEGVDVIMLSPVVETGWESVLKEAKEAEIPVFLVDRRASVDESLYVTFIGSDFVFEGREAGKWLAKKVAGKATIVELQGTTGSAPMIDRQKGFKEIIAKYPGMKVIDGQSGDFRRSGGKQVMEAFLKKHGKRIQAVFAHNDDMALGAIQAIEEAGMIPGKDIIVVSIDGVKDAFKAIIAGKLNCTVECNAMLGPTVFDALDKFRQGQTVPKRTIVEDKVYDITNAEAALPNRQY